MGAPRQPQPLELSGRHESRVFCQPARHRRAADLLLAGHSRHASAQHANRVGLHARWLAAAERRASRRRPVVEPGLGGPRGLPASDSTGVRPARADHGRDATRRRARSTPDPGASSGRGGGGPHDHPLQHGPSRLQALAPRHRPSQPDQDQRQHGRLAGLLGHARRGREARVGGALGRRHGDGSVDGRRPGRLSRGHHPERPRAHRYGADLLDGRRAPHRGPDRDGHHGDAASSGQAGRGLLHDPRRRAPRALAADQEAADRRGQPRRLAARQVDARARQRKPDVHAFRRDLRHHARVRRLLLAR